LNDVLEIVRYMFLECSVRVKKKKLDVMDPLCIMSHIALILHKYMWCIAYGPTRMLRGGDPNNHQFYFPYTKPIFNY